MEAAVAHEPLDDQAVVKKAVRAAGTKLGLSLRDLSQITGVRREVFSRRHEALSPKQMELCLLVIRVARSLSALVSGDSKNMRHWLETHNRALHAPPRELMNSVSGLVRTVQYLDAMRGKI